MAENVANAETPEFKPSDLAPPTFEAPASGVAPVTLVRTSPAHLAGADGTRDFASRAAHDFEVVPTGNGVSLEDEMMKVAGNQMDFQAATAIYTRGLGLIKTAIGR